MAYKDPEKQKDVCRKWRADNREKKRAYDKKWRSEHPGRSAVWARRRYEANPGVIYLKVRLWRANNPDKLQAQAVRQRAKRKLRKEAQMQADRLSYAFDLTKAGGMNANAKEAPSAVMALDALIEAAKQARQRWVNAVPVKTIKVSEHMRAKTAASQAARKIAATVATQAYETIRRNAIKLAGRNVDDVHYSELAAIATTGVYEGYLATALLRHATPSTDLRVRDLVSTEQLLKYHEKALKASQRVVA